MNSKAASASRTRARLQAPHLPGNEILWRAYGHVAVIAHFQKLARS